MGTHIKSNEAHIVQAVSFNWELEYNMRDVSLDHAEGYLLTDNIT